MLTGSELGHPHDFGETLDDCSAAPFRRVVMLAACLWLIAPAVTTQAVSPPGTMTWALHVTVAALWLDPAETAALASPYLVLYAIHDALVKPMPAGLNTPSLAESWSMSRDGLSYESVTA